MADSIFDKLDQIIAQQRESDEKARREHEETMEAIAGARTQIGHQEDCLQQSTSPRGQSFILQNFIQRSTHEYLWMGTQEDFKKTKKITIILILASMIAMILSSVVSTISFGFYTTYTLFENIWLFMSFFVLVYTCKTERKYNSILLSFYSFEKYETNAEGILLSVGCKKRYKIFFVLSCISFVLNSFAIWSTPNASLPLLVTILELGTLALIIVTTIRVVQFFDDYGPICITGLNDSGTQSVSIVWAFSELYTAEDFYKKYSFMN